MNKDINYTLAALVPLLRMNGEKVVSVEAVEDWYEIDGREYMKEVAEITYENGYRQYADIGCDANLTAVYDVIRVIQQMKPKSEKIERIVRDVYPNPEVPDKNVGAKLGTNLAEVSTDCISRQAAIDAIDNFNVFESRGDQIALEIKIDNLPSAQPEQRYTEEELRVFQHGISLSLLSKRSSQHWQYDEDTATEIKFLERLYEKVVADMRGEQDGRFN